MASPLRVRSYWTEVSLDVGQDSPETSPSAVKNTAQATREECIEDSMESAENATTRRSSGPFQPPVLLGDVDDELYALSPQGRKSLEAAISSMQMSEFLPTDRNQGIEHSSNSTKPRILDDCEVHLNDTHASHSDIVHEVSRGLPLSKKQTKEEVKQDESAGASDATLRQIQDSASGRADASSRKSNTCSKRGTTKPDKIKSSVSLERGIAKPWSGAKQSVHSFASVTKKAKPISVALSSQSARSTASVNKKPRPASVAPSSTLAALYAKRNNNSLLIHHTDAVPVSKASSTKSFANSPSTSLRPVLKERDPNLMIAEQPATKGNVASKPRTRKQRILSQTRCRPAEAPETEMTADHQPRLNRGVHPGFEVDLTKRPHRKRKYPVIEEGFSDQNGVHNRRRFVKGRSKLWSTPNRSTKSAEVNGAEEDQSIYDMPSSPVITKTVNHFLPKTISSPNTKTSIAPGNPVKTEVPENHEASGSETELLTRLKAQNAASFKREIGHATSLNDGPESEKIRYPIETKNNSGESIAEIDRSVSPVPSDRRVTEDKGIPCSEEQDCRDHKHSRLKLSLGTSEENPIVLSEHADSSSSSMDSQGSRITAPHPHTGNDMQTNFQKIPQTPVNLRSSPPMPDTSVLCNSSKEVVDRDGMRKSAIISFDQSGPRNQGLRKSATNTLLTTRSSIPTAGANFTPSVTSPACERSEMKFKSGPSSVAGTLRTSRSMQTAPPSNVANNVTDALDGFVEKFRKSGSSPEKFGEVMEGAVTPTEHNRLGNKTPEPMGPDNHFPSLDYLGGSNRLDIGSASTRKLNLLKPTQLRTASQLAMPPPAFKISKRTAAGEKSLTLSELDSTILQPVLSGDSCKLEATYLKQPHENESLVKPTLKRLCYSEISSPKNENQFAIDSLTLFCESKVSENVTSQPVKDSRKRIAKRVHHKPSRHVSQGRVDIGGSPAPKGYDFPANELVREHYSQHADLSSERSLDERFMRSDNNRSQSQYKSGVVEEKLIPASHQPEVFSSNRKQQPASPGKESQAITTIAVGIVDKENIVVRDAVTPATDPFTTSEQTRCVADQAPISLSIGEQLQASSTAQRDLSAELPGSPEPGTIHTNSPRFDQRKERECNTSMTLPEQPHGSRMVSTGITSHDEAERSSKNVARRRVSTEDTSITHGLGIWRSTLQPHQRNLFDELVNISHRLVSNLVTREDVMRDMIDDYRRCGIRLAEDMERDIAEKYQKYSLDLTDRKEKLRRDLSEFSEKLTECTDAVKEARFQRMKQASERAEEERKLREVMEKVC